MEKQLNLQKFLKAKRKSVHLTQADIAEKAGVGLRFIREMEQGKTTLRLDKVNQVLDLFGHKMAPIQIKIIDNNDEES
jgi:y4mF family transcriptional regulator